MLILSRRRDEKIVIDDRIAIVVVDIKGDQVKLGIEAPADVKIYRDEVYRAIQKENEEAAASAGFALPDIVELTKESR